MVVPKAANTMAGFAGGAAVFGLRNVPLAQLFSLDWILGFVAALASGQGQRGQAQAPLTDEQKLVQAMHIISSNALMDYVNELCSEKYGGRLTGTPAKRPRAASCSARAMCR